MRLIFGGAYAIICGSLIMNSRETDELVSIVVPLHNAAGCIAETIETVRKQTYKVWEMIIVDDGSSDGSAEIVKRLKSDRVKLICLKGNGGAAKARNCGIKEARGRFLCFLDADDLWEPEKLMKQVEFMRSKNCAFSFTSYEFADANGNPNGKKVKVPSKISYNQALKNTTIWTSTVMFDMTKLTKDDALMPDVRRGQDTATWWKVLRKVDYAYGMDEVTAYYRRLPSSLSSNKLAALKRTWNLYRNVEHLGLLKSAYCFSFYCFNAVKRRV